MNCSKSIKHIRKELGLSQQELALLIGLKHKTTVSSYELSKKVPGIPTALSILSLAKKNKIRIKLENLLKK